MALSADVVVVGGGLAGACAAWTAKAAGADVLLVARAPGATAISSGCIDFAAAGDAAIGDAAGELAARGDHPYSLLGRRLRPAIDAALSLLRAQLGFAGATDAAQKNLWLATPLGRVKAAALAQPSIAAGDLRALPPGSRLGVAALAGAQAIEARLMAKGLDELLQQQSSAVVLAADFYSHREDAQRNMAEIAADLDRPGRRAQLGESLARAARREAATHVLVPAVGLADAAAAQRELTDAAGRPVFESLGAPPSVPGLRLQRLIESALDRAGVKRIAGIAEGTFADGLQVVRGVECEPVRARAVVLAGGRYVGGGIRQAAASGELADSVFGLPAFAGDRRKIAALMTEELFAVKLRGRHAGLAAGLRADGELHALDDRGRPAAAAGAPVFACGAALGGFDPASGDGGLGVAAVTGCEAGRLAAEAERC